MGPARWTGVDPGEILGGLIPHARFTTVLILSDQHRIVPATALYSMRAGGGGFMDIDNQTLLNFGAMYTPAILAPDSGGG